MWVEGGLSVVDIPGTHLSTGLWYEFRRVGPGGYLRGEECRDDPRVARLLKRWESY